MHSTNPVLSRRDAFEPARGQQHSHYDPRMPGAPAQDPRAQRPMGQGLMTMDDVVTKTGVTLLFVILAAAAAFVLLPVELVAPVVVVGGLVTFILSLVVAFRRTVSAPLVLFFALCEGLFVGGMSKIFESVYSGIVVQAVLATLVAAGLTLGAYKFFNIRVTPRFQKVVFIATAAFAGAMLVNFLCALAGINLGLRSGTGGFSMLAVLVSAVAVVLAVLNLVMDFDYIEQGVRMGAPAEQSWKAAFGLTVTLVWLYIEMLRVVSYFRD